MRAGWAATKVVGGTEGETVAGWEEVAVMTEGVREVAMAAAMEAAAGAGVMGVALAVWFTIF